MGAVRYEWVRLRTLRSTWWLVAGCLVVGATLAAAYAWVADQVAADGVPVSGRELFAVTVTRASLAPLLVALLAASSIAGERRSATLVTAALLEPSRTRLLAAKCAVVGGLGVVVAACSVLLNDAVARAVLGEGAPWIGAGELLWCTGWLAGAALTWTLVGASTACIVRGHTAALLTVLVVPVVANRLTQAALAVTSAGTWPHAVLDHLPFLAASRLQVALAVDSPAVLGSAAGSPVAAFAAFASPAVVLAVLAVHSFGAEDLSGDTP